VKESDAETQEQEGEEKQDLLFMAPLPPPLTHTLQSLGYDLKSVTRRRILQHVEEAVNH
jgi:hypothetical protein